VTGGPAGAGPVSGGRVSGAVLCLLERDGDGFADVSLRALSFARSVAQASAGVAADAGGADAGGAGVAAVVFLAGDGDLADSCRGERAARGVSGLYVVPSDALPGYAPAAWARTLEQLAAGGAAVVAAAATDRGSEVMAHLGAMTGLPVAANCVSARAAGDGSWQLVRLRWAGSLLEDAVLEASCALLTVAADADAGTGDSVAAGAGGLAAGAGGLAAGPGGPVIAEFRPQLGEADLRVVAAESAEQTGGVSLATARVVVGGGRGVGGPDGFASLEELASLLGGVVGVSRVVTSQGWRPHRQQVGQTGTKISPELYLACGISGAIQHMAGCLTARHIVVVNTDQDAPIMSHAEYAVIGDLHEIIPALVAELRQRGGMS
jgi:electron transfer flavoprotein alpha subunit